MKQTKKLTRGQHKYLQSKGINTDGCRLVEETNTYIKYQKPDGEIETYSKI